MSWIRFFAGTLARLLATVSVILAVAWMINPAIANVIINGFFEIAMPFIGVSICTIGLIGAIRVLIEPR